MEWLWEAAKIGLSALAMAVSAAAWIYSRRAARIKEIHDDVQDLSGRVTMLETAWQSLPSQQAWTTLHTDIAGLRGDLQASGYQIRGLGAGLKRVENQISLLMENELRGKSQ